MPRIEGCVGDCLVTLSLRDVPEAADIFIAFGTPLAVSAHTSCCVTMCSSLHFRLPVFFFVIACVSSSISMYWKSGPSLPSLVRSCRGFGTHPINDLAMILAREFGPDSMCCACYVGTFRDEVRMQSSLRLSLPSGLFSLHSCR